MYIEQFIKSKHEKSRYNTQLNHQKNIHVHHSNSPGKCPSYAITSKTLLQGDVKKAMFNEQLGFILPLFNNMLLSICYRAI